MSGNALLLCDDVAHAVHQNVPLDFAIHTVLLLALPASVAVFGSVAGVKCPCGADMVFSAHPDVHRWALNRLGVSHGRHS